eukprot:jgi/Mesvir1/2843/Mv25447-RA.2
MMAVLAKYAWHLVVLLACVVQVGAYDAGFNIKPAVGPTTGGTVVTISPINGEVVKDLLRDLPPDTHVDVFCKFGSQQVFAIRYSLQVEKGFVLCTSPPFIAGVSSRHRYDVVQVVVGSHTLASARARFFYYDAPLTVMDVTPKEGPQTGGTVVRVTLGKSATLHDSVSAMIGKGVYGGLYRQHGPAVCRFDTMEVEAEYVPAEAYGNPFSEIVCRTPRMDVGVVAVSVSIDGQHFSDNKGAILSLAQVRAKWLF